MADLGDFGAAMRELDGGAERDTFRFLGETFTVHGDIPPMLMFQLGAAATGKIDDTEGMAALWEALRCSLTKGETFRADGEQLAAEDGSEFNRFYKVATNKRADMDSIMNLVFKLFEVQAKRPTNERPASSGGPLATSPSSSASSTPPVSSPAVLAAAPRPLDDPADVDRSVMTTRSLEDILTAF